MSGKPINSEQVKLYMKERKAGRTQKTASAKSGISERWSRKIINWNHEATVELNPVNQVSEKSEDKIAA